MKHDDQWFKPGDKVMRVLTPEEVNAIHPYPVAFVSSKMGEVYCVVSCWRGEDFNKMHLAGFGGLEFRCIAFRRVEEIKLCVRAAKRLSEPAETETVETQNA